jgi:hypothetical protein
MIPRDLSKQYLSTAPDMARFDEDCITAPAADVAAWLLGCAALGTMRGMSYRSETGGAHDAYFDEGMWLSRALVAYSRVRSQLPVTSAAVIDAWLIDQSRYMADMLHAQLSSPFPNRAANDYAVLGGAANRPYGSAVLYQGGQVIYTSAVYHNNRRAMMVLAVALAGLFFRISALIAEAKRYVQEWVRFAVYPGGEQGEWSRADGYGVPAQGLLYGAANIAVALEVAARLVEAGDTSLATYSTTEGANGTASATPKTIFTAMHTHLGIMSGALKYRTPAGNAIDWWAPVFSTMRVMHWTWFLQPAARLGVGHLVAQYMTQATPAGLRPDFYWAPWSGVCGIYADCRLGVPAYPQGRL